MKGFKINKKYLLPILGIILGTILVPYLVVPGLLFWWFYKKSQFTKKTKQITTAVVAGLFLLLSGWIAILHANDTEPQLKIIEPQLKTSVKSSQITIKGTYEPSDKKVRIDGKDIVASNGIFETVYQLKDGENKIEVSAGNWKRDDVILTVTRELTDDEKKSRLSPISKPQPKKDTVKPQPKKDTVRPFVESDLTNSSIKEELSKLNNTRGMSSDEIVEIKLIDNAGSNNIKDDKIVQITYKLDLSKEWSIDEKDIVQKTTDTLALAGEELFKHPKVGMVRIWTQTDFTDQYGKTEAEYAVRLGLTKETANKIQWDVFRSMVFSDYKKMLNIVDEEIINRAIEKNL